MIYVTHDQVEAMTMADKIVVLNAGQIEQVGSPLELYNNPANLFVAGFIGSPQDELRHRPTAGEQGGDHRHPARAHRRLARRPATGAGTVAVAEHLGCDTFLYVDVEDARRASRRARPASSASSRATPSG